MSKKTSVKNLRVTSPCTEDWEAMSGNKKVRFCSHCDLSVTNVSEMTRTEVKRLVRDSNGRLCVRYIQHPKTNAPVFADRLHQITRQTGIAAGVLGATLAASSLTYAQGSVFKQKTITELPSALRKINPDANKPNKTPSESGKLSGVITDRAGAVIPGALVQITFNNIKRTIMSNENGFYSFENLPEGIYAITFKSMGFKEYTIPQMKIEKTSDERMNAQLDVEATTFMMGLVAVRTVIENPLIKAVYNKDIKQVKSLIANGSDINAKEQGFSSRTALHTAIQENNLKIVRLLLNAGADVNSLDEEGNTPLMLLDDETNVEIVSLLIKYGTKLDIQNKENQQTALLTAAMEENFKVMRVLIESGANVNLRDEDGDSALDITDDEEIRQLLIAYGAEPKT